MNAPEPSRFFRPPGTGRSVHPEACQSAPVSTASTPGAAFAWLVSILRILAWAWGDRRTAPNDELWRIVNQISNLKVLIIETAFSNKERYLAEVSRHLCPSMLADELAKFERRAEIWITHLKPGEIELIMEEVEACAGSLRPRMLQNKQVFEF